MVLYIIYTTYIYIKVLIFKNHIHKWFAPVHTKETRVHSPKKKSIEPVLVTLPSVVLYRVIFWWLFNDIIYLHLIHEIAK